jgi:hypothetical protein
MPKRKRDGRKAPRQERRYERRMDSYDRRPGRRPPGRCILIVCEGAETEPNYFESLRDYLKLSTISVKIEDRAGAPISVVEEARAQVEKRLQDFRDGRTNAPPFEAIWCVFDVENPRHNQTFDRAVQVADQNDYQLAVSNPAFEFWYVLHFERTTRPFADGGELKGYLTRHIPGYNLPCQFLMCWFLLRQPPCAMPGAFWKIICKVMSVFRTHPQACICWWKK